MSWAPSLKREVTLRLNSPWEGPYTRVSHPGPEQENTPAPSEATNSLPEGSLANDDEIQADIPTSEEVKIPILPVSLQHHNPEFWAPTHRLPLRSMRAE